MLPKPKPSPYFKPGSAVEVRFDDDGFRGSWFSGTVIRHLAFGSFLVQFDNLIVDERSSKPLREVIGLNQLRPQPPQESHRKFKSGDKVDAFYDDGWWKGHVTTCLRNGRFVVYFKESEEHIVFPKEKLRIHRHWINHNWIPPLSSSESLNHSVSMEEIEIKGKLKRLKTNGRDREERRDRLSELPDCVLLHIMAFMCTKHAVQTCVLSKRWKDLCKRLTNLSYHTDFTNAANFSKFVSWVQSSRDDSIPLDNLDIMSCMIQPKVLNTVFKYAVLHNVQQLTMDICKSPNFKLLPSIFSCRSLTSLKLIVSFIPRLIILPESLQLPALKTLHLVGVDFAASNKDSVDPFSTCNMLDTLVLEHCDLHNSAKVLSISNSTISNLTISHCIKKIQHCHIRPNCEIKISTPNLISFTSTSPNFELPPCIFSSQTLTSLKLFNSFNRQFVSLPQSFQLPTLKTLHLVGVSFVASDKDCSEPFSTCDMLDTLVLEHCHLHTDAKVLYISNSTISSLTISHCFKKRPNCKIEISIPNLSSFTATSPNFELPPCIFCCQSLTSLKLVNSFNPWLIMLPKSLQLPTLKTLHLAGVDFTANVNDCAEPFSTCKMLETLVLEHSHLHNDAKVLCISNSTISSLTISDCFEGPNYKIELSTPNLSTFAITGHSNLQLSSTCNLSSLEEVYIDISHKTGSIINSWLQVLANGKILTLSSSNLKIIVNDLSTADSVRIVPPCFVRLAALKVKMQWPDFIYDEEINRVVKYLLQNSPMARVDIIKDQSDVPNMSDIITV